MFLLRFCDKTENFNLGRRILILVLYIGLLFNRVKILFCGLYYYYYKFR